MLPEYFTPGILIQEVDGSPLGFATKIKFPNGTLTNNGDGSYTYNPEDIVLDDITVDILTVASMVAAADDIIYVNDYIELNKKGTATAGTQYESQRVLFLCSNWNTTTTAAEDKYAQIYMQGLSSADGEAYYFNIKDQDNNIFFQFWGGISETKMLVGGTIMSNCNDGNTGLKWVAADQLSVLVGNLQMMDFNENDTQDYIRIGYTGDVDVYIGPAGKGLEVRGSDALLILQNTGYQYFYNESQSLNDDASFALPNSALGGWAMVLFDEGAEWAFVTWNSSITITGIQDSGANIAYTDSDAHYCIFNNSGTVTIKNRVGNTKRATVIGFFR